MDDEIGGHHLEIMYFKFLKLDRNRKSIAYKFSLVTQLLVYSYNEIVNGMNSIQFAESFPGFLCLT